MSLKKSEKDQNPLYVDKNIPTEERVEDLLQRMTLDEKVSQMVALGNFHSMGVFILEAKPSEFKQIEEVLFNSIFEKGEFSLKKAKKEIGNGLGQLSIIGRPNFSDSSATRWSTCRRYSSTFAEST